MSITKDDQNPDKNEQLPVPRREVQTLTRPDKYIDSINAFAEAFENEDLEDVSEAIVKIATITDIELVKEQNRSREAEYTNQYELERLRERAQERKDYRDLEQSKLRLRYFGLVAAVLLSLINGIGAVLLLVYGPALVASFGLLFALCLGLAALSAACAGAVFAIATGVAVRPKDFSDMLTAARNTTRGPDDKVSDTP